MERSPITHRFVIVSVVTASVATGALVSRATEVSPYEARVVASGASAMSGPGDRFYPTDTLAKGDTVEVYREKPGGWLGIRPTVNSFSWVQGRDLKLRPGGLGQIDRENAPSRIGSRLNDKHNACQVRLKKGEMVEVLGEEKVSGETWYKIAPPAGEFRWIQSSLVERIGPIRQASAESTAPSAPAAASPQNKAASSATIQPLQEVGNATAPPLMSNSTNGSTTSTPPATQPAANGGATTASPWVPVAPTTNTAPASPTMDAKPQASATGNNLADELAAIDVRLSRMAAAPVNLWNTERLERDTVQLMNRAQTPEDRAAVQATLEKINQFAVIGRRRERIEHHAGASRPTADYTAARRRHGRGSRRSLRRGGHLAAGCFASARRRSSRWSTTAVRF